MASAQVTGLAPLPEGRRSWLELGMQHGARELCCPSGAESQGHGREEGRESQAGSSEHLEQSWVWHLCCVSISPDLIAVPVLPAPE